MLQLLKGVTCYVLEAAVFCSVMMEVSLHNVVLILLPCLCSASPLEFKMESWRLREILPSGLQKLEKKNETREWGEDYLDFDLDNQENAVNT